MGDMQEHQSLTAPDPKDIKLGQLYRVVQDGPDLGLELEEERQEGEYMTTLYGDAAKVIKDAL
jgi:hypothetical protein